MTEDKPFISAEVVDKAMQEPEWPRGTEVVVYAHRKKRRQCRKCGHCGYYMAYAKSDGTKDHYGDCASIGMNNECNEGRNHFKNPDEELLQVDSTEDACGFFKANRTRRTKEYIKAHPDNYYQDTHFKPKSVR